MYCFIDGLLYTADGYCRSEGIVAVYLQKKESAKRIYATVVHSKTNSDGYKEEGKLLLLFGGSFCCFCCVGEFCIVESHGIAIISGGARNYFLGS